MSTLDGPAPNALLDAPAPRVWFISEYTVELGYGGPEEGGWWYDWHTHVRIRHMRDNECDAVNLARGMNAAQQERDREAGKLSRHSVIGTPDTVYLVEQQPGEHTDTERPHYE